MIKVRGKWKLVHILKYLYSLYLNIHLVTVYRLQATNTVGNGKNTWIPACAVPAVLSAQLMQAGLRRTSRFALNDNVKKMGSSHN